MRQLFSVGEEVILCSEVRPDLKGEDTIYKVLKKGDIHTCRGSGKQMRLLKRPLGYILETPFLDEEGIEYFWEQKSLRKKHRPSTESFNEMMRNLNTIKV